MKKLRLLAILFTVLIGSIKSQVHQKTFAFGGIYDDEATSSITDTFLNNYVTGVYVDSIDIDPSTGSAILRTTNAPDAFIAKYDDNGNYLWSTTINGVQVINIRDIEFTNSQEEFYVTGEFIDTAQFDSNTPNSRRGSNGAFDVFVAKYDTSGNFIWAISFGGPAPDWGYDLAVDGSDNIYVTGSFLAMTDFDPSPTGNTTITTFSGSPDIFIAKYDDNGNFIWAKNAGSTQNDEALAIEVDPSGNSYITGFIGTTSSFDNISVGNRGAQDIFLAKYDPNGNALWAKNFGGPAPDRGTSLKLDKNELYLSANYQALVYMDTSSGATPAHTALGNSDVLFSKFDTSGTYIWSKSIGGTMVDMINSIDLDTAGSIYLAGSFEDTMNFAVGIGDYKVASKGGTDAFIAKYDQGANLIWAHGLGSGSNDKANHIASDYNNFYVLGNFQGIPDFDPDTSILDQHSAFGMGSGFVSKYSICYGSHSFDTVGICPGSIATYGSYYSFSQTGDHHLRLVDPTGCDTLVTLHIIKNDTVNTQISQQLHTLFVDDTTAAVQWYDCNADTLISGETDTLFTPTVNGSYAAILTDTAGCVDTTACIPVLTIGLKENHANQLFSVYPNPAKDQLFVESTEKTTLLIYDQTGKEVYSEAIQKGKSTLDLNSLSPGIYFVRLANYHKYRKVLLQ